MKALAPPRVPAVRRASVQSVEVGVSSALYRKRGPAGLGPDGKWLAEYNYWQDWARRFSREIGAASFQAGVIADLCARSELRVEIREGAGDDWQPTDDPRFIGLLELYANDLQGPDELIRLHAWHYQVAGEMVQVQRDNDRGGVEYGIYSTAACEWDKPDDGLVTVKLVPDGRADKGTAFVVPREQVARFWLPDHEWQGYAWSPMASTVDDLKRYRALSKYALKTADSAVAMSGLLWSAGEPHVPTGDLDDADATDAGTPQSALEELYYSTARMRTTENDDITSVAPPWLHWDRDYGKPEWVKLGEPLDPNGIAYRAEALEDFARGSLLPSTVVMGGGVGDANHWSEWLASRKMFDSGVAPTMDRICHLDLTRSFAWPRALVAGWMPDQLPNIRVGYDPTEVIVKPDNSQLALDLWKAGAISVEALLEATGFSLDDMLTDPAQRAWLLSIMAKPPPPGGPAPVATSDVATTEAPPSPNGTSVTAAVDEEPRPFDGPDIGTVARAVSRLTRLRQQLGTRLLAEYEHAYEHALKQAGAKFNTRARGRAGKQRQEQVAAAVRNREPLRPLLAAVGMKEDEILRGALDTFRNLAVAEFHLFQQRAAMVLKSVGSHVTVPDRADADSAVDFLVAGLAAEVRMRLLDGEQAVLAAAKPSMIPKARKVVVPEGFDPGFVGRVDADELAKAGARLVRNALKVHEGQAQYQFPSTPDQVPHIAIVHDAPNVEEKLAQEIDVQPLWTWEHGFYGEPASVLEAHDDLHGFVTNDREGDPELANTDAWPYDDYYHPDDHPGCSCEWVIDDDSFVEGAPPPDELAAEIDVPFEPLSPEPLVPEPPPAPPPEPVPDPFALRDWQLKGRYGEMPGESFPEDAGERLAMARTRKAEIDAEGSRLVDSRMSNLQGMQSEAVEYYSEDGYQPMNDYLRFGQRGLDDWLKEMSGFGEEDFDLEDIEDFLGFSPTEIVNNLIPAAQEAIQRGSTLEDVTSFRFMNFKKGDALDTGLVPGAEFTDQGFVSTTVAPYQWAGLAEPGPTSLRMEIRVPKGHSAIWVGPDEAELLLPAGSTFRVLERVGNVVRVEAL